MCQHVSLEVTLRCAFVFTLIAAERLLFCMNKNVSFQITSLIPVSSALYQSYGLTEYKYQESPKENNSGKSESELKYLHNESESEDKG